MVARVLKFVGLDPKTGVKVGRASDTQYLSEQDGPVERKLKVLWTPVLHQHGVARAYLVRVRLSADSEITTALAMTQGTTSEIDIVRALEPAFRATMSDSTYIDMMFLDSAQEVEVTRVCRSFLHAI